MPHRRAIDWTLEDYHELLRDEEPENLMLEYKASMAVGDWEPKRRDELAKDLSAFANSAGGLIIIGIGEENHKPKILDNGVNTLRASKEAIESALMARVSPRIEGLTIKEILNPDVPDHSYFVIGVPRSMRAPHMCVPYHRYYRRYNFESVPMEHYELDDVRRRQTEPLLTPKLRLTAAELEPATADPVPCNLAFGVINEGSVTAHDVLVRLYVPSVLVGEMRWKQNGVTLHQETKYGGVDVRRFDVYLRDTAGPIPIFPKDDQPFVITPTVGRKIMLNIPPEQANLFLKLARKHSPLTKKEKDILKTRHLQQALTVQIFAENMRMRQFDYPLKDLLRGIGKGREEIMEE